MDAIIETHGIRMPKLGLGTWQMRGAEATKAVAGAIELGYRHIDTARMYDNEDAIGASLASVCVPREKIHVTSKVWHTDLAPEAIRRALAESLRLLRLGYIDLYLIHWPAPGMDLPAALDALMRLREQGLARAIGVSNFTVDLLRQAVATGAAIACNQVEYHVGLSQRPVLEFCRENGIALSAYSPLARGAVTQDATLASIARKHGATSGQVALKWLLDQDGVAAVPKAASRANQRTNLDALALRLDDADRAAIDALPKNHRLVDPGWGPRWDAA